MGMIVGVMAMGVRVMGVEGEGNEFEKMQSPPTKLVRGDR